ncbi:MAG: helix-turn-helix domain-containing protein [Proteobacteria bacterium]|nr:helix-turn-helix domain-containing protein [Pseudomonadota bacterium]
MTWQRTLADSDHERIHELAERGWKVGRIAQAIGKNHSTVYWFMLRNGLVERPAGNRKDTPYRRAGRWVYPWNCDEDKLIESRRAQGGRLTDIAAEVAERFGKPRTPHSVHVRLIMLAATTGPQGDAA